MRLLFFICFIIMFLIVCICEKSSTNRIEEGYPIGLLSYCPDPPEPVVIRKSQLKHLLFIVQGRGRTRRKYNYWTAKNMAKDPRIDFKRKTMILATGYLDGSFFPISNTFSNLYEDLGYNVILIDNNKFNTVHYFRASKLMVPVGKHVADILVNLTHQGLDPKKIELLGFSLGCQTISYIAKNYQQITGQNISKLTCLSPAGPCFRTLGPDRRLSPTDADFVEVIHTNIDGFGMATRMGHVDIYVNGGEYQPSDLNMYPCTATCSHFRSLLLWESALKNPKAFIAIKCDSIQQARDMQCYDRKPLETNTMGLMTNRSMPGIYYLATGLFYPFYLKENGLDKKYGPWIQISNLIRGSDV